MTSRRCASPVPCGGQHGQLLVRVEGDRDLGRDHAAVALGDELSRAETVDNDGAVEDDGLPGLRSAQGGESRMDSLSKRAARTRRAREGPYTPGDVAAAINAEAGNDVISGSTSGCCGPAAGTTPPTGT